MPTLAQPREQGRATMDFSLRNVMKITAAMKLSILCLIFLAFHFLPFNTQNYQGNALAKVSDPDFWTSLKTWDAQHYLYLAKKGYKPDQMSNAFYPLFPFLIYLLNFLLLNHPLAAGLILSHLFTFAGVAFIYLIGRKTYGEKTAFLSCVLFLAFPGSFYLGLIYTESLFVALAAALFYYAGENRVGPASLCAALLMLTRPTGLLVLVPVLSGLVLGEYFRKKEFRLAKWLLPAGFLAGYGLYLGLMKLLTGDFFASAHAEKFFLTNYSTSRLFHPVDWFLYNFINTNFTVTGLHSGILNRLWFLLYLAVLFFSRKRLNRTLMVYSLVLGLVPALSGDFASYMRYLVVLFPLFFYLAIRLKNNMEAYLMICLPLQALFAVAHALYYWVA